MGNKKTMAGNQSKHPDYYYYTSMILPIRIGLGELPQVQFKVGKHLSAMDLRFSVFLLLKCQYNCCYSDDRLNIRLIVKIALFS